MQGQSESISYSGWNVGDFGVLGVGSSQAEGCRMTADEINALRAFISFEGALGAVSGPKPVAK